LVTFIITGFSDPFLFFLTYLACLAAFISPSYENSPLSAIFVRASSEKDFSVYQQ